MTDTIARDFTEARESLEFHLEDTAGWRARKAAEYPDDARNGEAVRLLKQLIDTVPAVSGPTLAAFAKVWDDHPDRASEAFGEILRSIGFGSAPACAEDLVQDFLSIVR